MAKMYKMFEECNNMEDKDMCAIDSCFLQNENKNKKPKQNKTKHLHIFGMNNH